MRRPTLARVAFALPIFMLWLFDVLLGCEPDPNDHPTAEEQQLLEDLRKQSW